MADYIDRQAAIDALWKALWKYEDESEQAFQTHEELDIGDWFQHRIFVQNMSDIDRQTIIDMPAADVEPVVRCKDVPTNADRIRAMSDKELAEWIIQHDCRTNIYGYDTIEAILDWLMKEEQDG